TSTVTCAPTVELGCLGTTPRAALARGVGGGYVFLRRRQASFGLCATQHGFCAETRGAHAVEPVALGRQQGSQRHRSEQRTEVKARGSRSARIGKHLPQRGAAAAEPRHAVTLVGPFSRLEARIVRLGTGPRSQCEGRSSVGLARELNANAQRARRARAERGVEMAFGRSGKPVQIDAGFVLLHELEEHGNGFLSRSISDDTVRVMQPEHGARFTLRLVAASPVVAYRLTVELGGSGVRGHAGVDPANGGVASASDAELPQWPSNTPTRLLRSPWRDRQ